MSEAMDSITPESLKEAGFEIDLSNRKAWGVYVRGNMKIHHQNGNKTVHRITVGGIDENFSPPITSMVMLNSVIERYSKPRLCPIPPLLTLADCFNPNSKEFQAKMIECAVKGVDYLSITYPDFAPKWMDQSLEFEVKLFYAPHTEFTDGNGY